MGEGGGGKNKIERWIFVSGERQCRKARERKTRKQTKLKNNVSSTAVLNDDSNTFVIFNE